MNKLKNKNKSISNQNTDKINSNINKQIKSVNNLNCIGPCYPPGIVFYNPLTMSSQVNYKNPSCPIKPKIITVDDKKIIREVDTCKSEDINNNYAEFDIFNDFFQIAVNDNMFLSQIYNINNIKDTVHFITNNFDSLPIYSQKRLLISIFEVYYKYIEFPKKIFIEKLKNVLEVIFQIKNIQEKKIILELDKINKLNINLYEYFENKYLKK
jgi:hypothetical protein